MSFSPRNAAKVAIAADNFICPTPKKHSQLDLFGRDVFSMKVMRERLPKSVYKRLEKAVDTGESLAEGDADVVASTMKEWAIENGATHYTHWFQPMTGLSAEKHDAFISPAASGTVINEFSGKMLIKGEPDASSFPSGGIRSTFEARGYTAWDPTSPAFLMENACGKTLYIPTVFFSYTGESLDRKVPLLRSTSVISKQALRILRLFGNDTATSVNPMVGAEQEYFLVDRRFFRLRNDLMLAGRTVLGAAPAKGQELEDHYFGSINQRVLAFMAEVEENMLALGIPAKTRHNEVAPGQFELAPVFESANLANDHNMLTMEILRITAEKHGFACLLHEKPFAGVNGSGKHNNWSLCDSNGNNMLDPGSTPQDNAQFLVFLAAVMKAVHEHSSVLRLGTVGAGNDHRLGANEAPPAIISIFLGEQLTNLLKSIIAGKADGSGWEKGATMEVGVTSMPPLPKDISDRNRTSPFAFTGNKFEFRAVGSSQSIAPVNIVLNAAVAVALDDIATELEAAVGEGTSITKAVQDLLPRLFQKHMDVVFNGNGYSDEWQVEAAKRGLVNDKDSVSAILRYNAPHVMEVFMRHGILNERELLARQEILLESYAKSILVEAKVTASMVRGTVLPASFAWQKKLASMIVSVKEATGEKNLLEEQYLKDFRKHVTSLLAAVEKLEKNREKVEEISGTHELATSVRDILIPLMNECRVHADAIEALSDDQTWPLPTYNELLWQH